MNHLLVRVLIALIQSYRSIISPYKRPSCRFYPTCSQYALEALSRYGAWRGLCLTIKRILRCGPWHSGGYDPVP